MTQQNDLVLNRHPGGIVRLTLARAPVNALSAAGLMHFAATLEDLGADDEVRAIVIDSAFRVFSAGLDLKEAQGFDAAGQSAIVQGLNAGFLALYACPKPTVTAVGGAAIAGGLFYVLASDHRVGTARASLGLAEIRVGVDFPVGPLEIARAALAPDMLRRLMLGGHPIPAETALAQGILDEIAAPEALLDTALEAAARLAAHPPGAYAAVKAQIRGAVCTRIREGMDADAKKPWFTPETKAAMQRMIG